ncbi:MAG: HD-GYP domain-containing protein [Fusobacteriota bacterium]
MERKNIIIVSKKDVLETENIPYNIKKFEKYMKALDFIINNQNSDFLILDIDEYTDDFVKNNYYINLSIIDHVIISNEKIKNSEMRKYFREGAIDVLKYTGNTLNIYNLLETLDLDGIYKRTQKKLESNRLKKDLLRYQILYKITKLLRLNLNLENVLQKISGLILELMGKNAVFVLPNYEGKDYDLKGKLTGINGKTIKEFIEKHDIYSPIKIKDNFIVILPMIIKNNIKGYLLLEKENSNFRDFEMEWINDILSQAGVIIENSDLLRQAQHINIEMAESLSFAIDAKDHYTQGHSKRVEKISELIAKKLGMDENRIRKLKMAALLHDVGKIGLSENILNKKSSLTDFEYGEIKKHPVKSSEIIRPIRNMKYISSIVKQHHEKWNGTGYPDGLNAEEIIFEARIISIADAFDAMTSNRSYRKGMNIEVARKEILDNSGTQFDPKLVKIFLEEIDIDELQEILTLNFD